MRVQRPATHVTYRCLLPGIKALASCTSALRSASVQLGLLAWFLGMFLGLGFGFDSGYFRLVVC